MKPTLNCCKTR